MDSYPIIVGYDGSAGGRAALRWALDEAAHHAAEVRLVYAVERPVRTAPVVPMPGDLAGDGERARAESILADAVVAATRGARQPAVPITGLVLDGPAVAVLCEQSGRARMVVLGSRGLGGFTGLFVGSVSVAVAAHAHCPVIVIRDKEAAPSADRPVAVGVDESAEAQLTIGFALEEAAVRGVDLVVVRAWTPPSVPWRSDVRPLVLDAAELEAAERHVLTAALQGWHEKYPAVTVTTRLIPRDARHALTAASRDAQLMVVGSRGRGGFDGLLLGSVSQYLLHHAACPVAVVRQPGPARAEPGGADGLPPGRAAPARSRTAPRG